MDTIRRRSVGCVLLAVLTSLATWFPAPAQEKAPPGQPQVVDETGKLTRLSAEDWARLPRHKVEVKGREGETLRYEGASLTDVLRSAGVPFEGHLRAPRVSYTVLVEAADGYRASFALAEVDPSVTDKVVLVADRLDGKPLPEAAGPYRLVVPSDKIHSRWVRQVTRITVQRPAPAAKK